MADILTRLDELTADGGGVVLATLVATEGARPRRPGAKLLVDARGTRIGAVTLGGCVETRVAELVEEVIADGSARLLRVDLAEEEAFDLGMGCAATLELLVEPVSADGALSAAAAWIRAALEAGHAAALVAHLGTSAARLAVLDDGTTHGSLDSETLDAAAVALARTTIGGGAAAVAVVPGSGERLFIDVFAPPLRLCVFGAGPVTEPLLRFARELGMRTVVVDARPERLNTVGDADTVRVGSPGRIARDLGIGARDAVVVLSHDYKYELPVLEEVLRGEFGYVGLLGSRKRGEAVAGLLAERGVPHDAIARLRVPAGLDVGAEAPAEIALSILGEIMALRTGRSGRPLRP